MAEGDESTDLTIRDSEHVFVRPTGAAHPFKLVKLKGSVLEMEDLHFHHDSAVMMPDVDRGEAAAPHEGITGISVLAQCYLHAEANPDQKLLVAGHTDRSGSDQYNLSLSRLRARNTLHMIVGERDEWITIALEKSKVRDYQRILKWLHTDFGWLTNPGPVDDNNGPQTQSAVRAFQKRYNTEFAASISVDGIVGKQTWSGFFDTYNVGLQKLLNTDQVGLDGLRGKLRFLNDGQKTVGCGEHHPISEDRAENYRSPADRRVELLFFDPEEVPVMDCHPGAESCNPSSCEIYDSNIYEFKPIPVKPVPPPQPVPTVALTAVESSDSVAAGGTPVWRADDDFSPRLNERARLKVHLENLVVGRDLKLRADFGRLTNTVNDPATADTNESFTLVARVDKAFTATAATMDMEIEWDGKGTVAVPQEFSNRTTQDTNAGSAVNIPLAAIANGAVVLHGLYSVDEISLLDNAGGELAKTRPPNVDLSVPVLVNLTFNANWAGDLSSFGLVAFQAQLEEALRRFGGRDYQIRNPTPANRINARYFTDASISNAQSMLCSVGGVRAGLFGSTPDGPAPLSDNIYIFHEGLNANVTIFPGTFMLFNQAAGAIGPNDQATFQAAFTPLGVTAAASSAAPGVATARAVSGAGVVTGATDATDRNNVTVTLDANGLASVTSTNPAVVPAARATSIQNAMRTFVRMVGNTINHEAAHALGVASRVRASNSLTISGTTVTSPLNGDGGAHNRVTNNTNIVDAGGTRSFVRRVEATGTQQQFSGVNAQYLRNCAPFDAKDD